MNKNMTRTLRIAFALRNTYRVNAILFSLKQIPLVKKLLPAALYKVRGLKIFANIVSLLWEVISIFLGKFFYLALMVAGSGIFYAKAQPEAVFLHILFFLTLIGAYGNTFLFEPSRDKYYAMILMRMNAREYTLIHYGYRLLKLVVGFLPFMIYFGLRREVPLALLILLPFAIAGMKTAYSATKLRNYERGKGGYNENKLSKGAFVLMFLLLAAAYVPPVSGFVLSWKIYAALFVFSLPFGLLGLRKILTFNSYYEVNKELLSDTTLAASSNVWTQAVKQGVEKKISVDTSIKSDRHGFEYLNDLFVKRHRKILWSSTRMISIIILVLVALTLFLLRFIPEEKGIVNQLVMMWLPYFLFIMYAINRGTYFTQALFMNCDHSLLTYAFYKRPDFILKLFRIRLREIMKINAVPALILGGGLALILYASGGTDNPLNYAVLIVSVLCMSLFFSTHYLTIYYLLQPYNAGTEIRSATYRIVTSVTYLVCFFCMQIRMPIMNFGLLTIVFCILYVVVASILIYRFAPKTFKLRA